MSLTAALFTMHSSSHGHSPQWYNHPSLLPPHQSQSQSQSYITTDSQSVSKSWCRAQSGTFDQRSFFFFFESFCLVIWGRPLWREVRSVICQSTVVSQYLHTVLHTFDIYNIYLVLDTFTIKGNKIQYLQYIQASFSPGFAQQGMP
jgi:hypothetical protein